MSETVPQKFEEKLDRIEAIVKELEGNKVELDRAVALFKEGKALARACEAELKGVHEQLDKAMNEAPG
jgi:exodeoxyribonuclease VII small subunit